MTPSTASSHLPPAGDPAARLASLSPRRFQPHALCRGSGQNRPVDRRRGAKLATAMVDPPPITPDSASPTQAAAPSNPHRRKTASQPPRVPSWEAFGRRTSAPADSSRRAGIRNPSPCIRNPSPKRPFHICGRTVCCGWHAGRARRRVGCRFRAGSGRCRISLTPNIRRPFQVGPRPSKRAAGDQSRTYRVGWADRGSVRVRP
jgi:hypothetical protein